MSPTEAVKRRVQGVSSTGYHILAPESSSVERGSPSVMDSVGRVLNKTLQHVLDFLCVSITSKDNNQGSETKTTLKHLLRPFLTSYCKNGLIKHSSVLNNPGSKKGIYEFSASLASWLNSSRQGKAQPQWLFYFQSDPCDCMASFNKLVICPKHFASEFQHNQGGQIKRTTVMKSALSLICWNKE